MKLDAYPLYYDTGFRIIYKCCFDFAFLLSISHNGSQQRGGATVQRPAACTKGGIFIVGMGD